MTNDISLYKELVEFCNSNKEKIEKKFQRKVEFSDFNERCFEEMYFKIKAAENPVPPKVLKERINGLKECYRYVIPRYLVKRNQFIKGLDIQLGQWYEKAFQLFLASKGIVVKKKGFPYPDFAVVKNNKIKAYYELKFIQLQGKRRYVRVSE